MRRSLDQAVAERIGYVYFTDDRDPNPWDRLPSYRDAEVAAVEHLNRAPAP
jgi:hypothetical protein